VRTLSLLFARVVKVRAYAVAYYVGVGWHPKRKTII